MRITVVMGFFLPMPPVAGGATEKSWHALGHALQKLGHQVTLLSRSWSDWPSDEVIDGVRHVRLKGFNHSRSLAINIVNDLRWSRRVLRVLPKADVTISNVVTLPRWLAGSSNAGHVVVMPGRMPKGQFRWYGRVDQVLTVSRAIETAVLREKPSLAPALRRFGYPIATEYFAVTRSPSVNRPLTIGYVGRIHPEKGLDLLPTALLQLKGETDLPSWRIIVCGPADVPRGGAGLDYSNRLQRKLVAAVGAERVEFRSPVFGDTELANVYAELDVFCYPSLARGETFGVAVAEAMATGAVPVVSQLPCFTEFVNAGENGETFAHESPNAAANLAVCMGRLLRDPDQRNKFQAAARETVRRYDVNAMARQLSVDFSALK